MKSDVKKQLSKDPVMAGLIEKHGEIEITVRDENIFERLLQSIVSQQLSDKAAETIWQRYKGLYCQMPFPNAEAILETPDDKIRECGLSYSKAGYVKNVAAAILDGKLQIDKLAKQTDKETKKQLTAIKGVGDWTAEMILAFSLGREDIFAVGDVGLRNAVSKLYKVDRDDYTAIKKISKKWKPYRTYASRYLWKSLK